MRDKTVFAEIEPLSYADGFYSTLDLMNLCQNSLTASFEENSRETGGYSL